MLPFNFKVGDTTLSVCGAVWTANCCLAAVGVGLRDASRLRQVSPLLTTAAHFAALLWWLDLGLSNDLKSVWKKAGGCWVWALSVRGVLFTLFVACLIAKQHLAAVQWRTDDEGGRLRAATLVMFIAGVPSVLLVIVNVIINSLLDVDDGDACEPPRGCRAGLVAYQACLCLVFLGVIGRLYRAIFTYTSPRTRRSMRVKLPSFLDGAVEAVGVLLIVALDLVMVFHGSEDDPDSLPEWRAMAVAVFLPTVMLWFVMFPPTCKTLGSSNVPSDSCCACCFDSRSPDEEPLMNGGRSSPFDASTGLYGPGLKHLPQIRREQADGRPSDTASLSRSSPESSPQHDEVRRVFTLVRKGNPTAVRDFLVLESSTGPGLVSLKGPDGRTVLHTALDPDTEWEGDTRAQMVELLIDMQARMVTPDADGNTAVHYAAMLGEPSMLVLMVSRSRSSQRYGEVVDSDIAELVNKLSSAHATALHIAVTHEGTGLITTLLGLGADPNRASPADGEEEKVPIQDWEQAFEAQVGRFSPRKSAFHLACEMNLPDVARQLARTRVVPVDPNQPGPFGMTPLATACFLGRPRVVMVVLEIGGDAWYQMRERRRLSVMHCAAIGGDATTLYHVYKQLASTCPAQQDSDSWTERASMVLCATPSESEVSTVCAGGISGPRYLAREISAGPAVAGTPVSPRMWPASDSLLGRAMAVGERPGTARLEGVRRTTSLSFEEQATLGSYRDAITEEDIRGAIAVLAARGALPPTPVQRALLESLTRSWCVLSVGTAPHDSEGFNGLSGSVGTDHGENVEQIVEAVKIALASSDSRRLLEVLHQDQYQWNGNGFSSLMTEPKSRQLASEISKRVVNPAIATPQDADQHQATLLRQCGELRRRGRGEEAGRIQHALDTLVSACRQRGSASSPRIGPRMIGEGIPGGQVALSGGQSNCSLGGLSFLNDSPAAPALRSGGVFGESPAPARGSYLGEVVGLHAPPSDPDGLLEVPPPVQRQLDRVDCWRRTPLHYAVERGHCSAVFLLVAFGCNTVQRDQRSSRRKDLLGLTPLQYAERGSSSSSVQAPAIVAFAEAQKVRACLNSRRLSGPASLTAGLARTPPSVAAADALRRVSSQPVPQSRHSAATQGTIRT
eukprot:Hpha_TRINITY_DN9375_c0_g1::TRINITY_DN9375_c0_g1_i1::g.25929::m.25929